MLSSRYLHLHEALGLGPMWLNQTATVRSAIPKPHAAHTAAPAPQTKPAALPVAAPAHTRTADAPAARPSPVPQAQDPRSAVLALVGRREQAAQRPNAPPRPAPVLHIAVRTADIAVISVCPSTQDTVHNQLFHGNTGILLDNIFHALGIPSERIHRTCWTKTAPVASTLPDTETIAAALPEFRRELAECRAQTLIFVGQTFTQSDVLPLLEQLCANRQQFVIPHPAQLLRHPEQKAQVWQTLKPLKRAATVEAPDTGR